MEGIFSRACSFWAQTVKNSCTCGNRGKDEKKNQNNSENNKDYEEFKKNRLEMILSRNYDKFDDEEESIDPYYSSEYDSEFLNNQRLEESQESPSFRAPETDVTKKKKGIKFFEN
jgi:hypothetical protein